MDRKPHPSSKLKTLPDEDQEALYQFLTDHTLAEGVQWVFSNNGVRTNDSSLSEFRGWYGLRRRVTSWNAEAEDLKQILSTDASIDPNLVPKLAEAFFMARAAEAGDAKTFGAMASIIQRHKEFEGSQKAHQEKMVLEARKLKRKDRALDQAQKKLEQAERKVAALEEQAAATRKAAERAKEKVKTSQMDDATRENLMAEIDHIMLGKPKPQAA
jgi:hypothetical protein